MSEKWSEEALEARREYYRQYRAKHRAKLAEYERRYWHKAAARRITSRKSFSAVESS